MIGVFLSGILCVLFWHKSPVFFWVICWHFLPFKRVFFTILFFIDFFGMKLEKNFSVMVNALKFLYLFKWFGLFYLEFWVSVFFDTIDAFSFVWFFDSFHPLRVNCLKLSPSWDLFWWKWTKNYSCKGKSFYIFIFSLVIRVILSRNLRGCYFGTIHPLVNSAFLYFGMVKWSWKRCRVIFLSRT